MDRMLGSARAVGIGLVLVPVVLGLGLNLFPNYDARSEFFAGSYSNIVEAGMAFPVSLVVLVLASMLLVLVVLGLRRAPQSDGSGGLDLVFVALSGSSLGILLGAVLSIPVAVWASQVKDGSLAASAGVAMSQALASTSQTLILLVGLGGLAVGLTVLGVLSWRFGWTPPIVFWATIVAAGVIVVGGFSITLFWVALGVPPVLWTLMIGGSLAIKGEYANRT